MNKQIIGFCGSHATGKTTLANYLAEQYPDQIDLCVEGVREAARSLGINSVREVKPEQRQVFEERVLAYHLAAIERFYGNDKPILITDRTVIDILAYTRLALHNFEPVSDEFLQKLMYKCEATYYSKIIYFDLVWISQDEGNDGFRDMHNREKIAKDILLLLRTFRGEFLRISDSMVQRIEFMKWQLGL